MGPKINCVNRKVFSGTALEERIYLVKNVYWFDQNAAPESTPDSIPRMVCWPYLLTFAYAVPCAWNAFSTVSLSTPNSPFKMQLRDCPLEAAFYDFSCPISPQPGMD